jgi:hypothetical protein
VKNVIRPAAPEDMPRILPLHRQTERHVGMEMDLPGVDDPAILGYWVVERDGVIVKAFYEEMCIEHVEIWGFQKTVFASASAKGCRYLHCFVPPAIDGWLSRLLFRGLMFLTSRTARRIGLYLKAAQFKKTGFIHYNRRLR